MTKLKKLTIANTAHSQHEVARSRGMTQRMAVAAAKAVEEREAEEHKAHSIKLEIQRNDRAAIFYDESQRTALKTLLTSQYGAVSGPAGSGKTTIMAKALEMLEEITPQIDWSSAITNGKTKNGELRPSIVLCTLANVAAQNMASKIDKKWTPHCMSLNSALCYVPVDLDYQDPDQIRVVKQDARHRFEPAYNEHNKAPYDVFIIDEGGVVSRDLWENLLKAAKPTAKIYMLGDLYQLSGIGGASPLPFAIDGWPTAFLEKIYRQADGSPIIDNAHRVRAGKNPVHHDKFFRCGKNERLPERILDAQHYITAYIRHLYKEKLFDPAQDIIICPQNDHDLGQRYWNSTFRMAFNPPKRDPDTNAHLNPPILIRTAIGATTLAVGDKVMATSNGGRTATERRLQNGSLGIITAIRPNENYKGSTEGLGEMAIDDVAGYDQMDFSDMMQEAVDNDNDVTDEMFEEHERELEEDKKSRASSHVIEVTEIATGEVYRLDRSAEVATLEHAYAVTAHKFQGSQARRVVVLAHGSYAPQMLSREWLYTAVTRAREAVILLHDSKGLIKCLTRQALPGKTPWDKAAKLRAKYENRPHARPRIPVPAEVADHERRFIIEEIEHINDGVPKPAETE